MGSQYSVFTSVQSIANFGNLHGQCHESGRSMISHMPRFPIRATLRSASFLSGVMAASRKEQPRPVVRAYTPVNPHGPFPYSATDMTPMDPGNDKSFYTIPRFVTHIDDNAIQNLRRYYAENLPRSGTILDLCSSWISHYPPKIEEAQKNEVLKVFGIGLNKSELSNNPALTKWTVHDLNEFPEVAFREVGSELKFNASTCVVSIDYLTRPVEVLRSIRMQTVQEGKIHLVISNRCFPTKVVGRWLKISEDERLEMVGDYLWWSGWRGIEIVTVVKGSFMNDPLWVVRGTNANSGASG